MIGFCRNAFQPGTQPPNCGERVCEWTYHLSRRVIGCLEVERGPRVARSVVGTTVGLWAADTTQRASLLPRLPAALQCQTVQSCARVGLAPTSRQATRQETKEWGLPRSWGGGGAFESQQHFQRVRPDLGTRASKRGHCTPCATPRACTSCSCSTKRIHKRRLQHLGTNFKSSNKNPPSQNVHHFCTYESSQFST